MSTKKKVVKKGLPEDILVDTYPKAVLDFLAMLRQGMGKREVKLAALVDDMVVHGYTISFDRNEDEKMLEKEIGYLIPFLYQTGQQKILVDENCVLAQPIKE